MQTRWTSEGTPGVHRDPSARTERDAPGFGPRDAALWPVEPNAAIAVIFVTDFGKASRPRTQPGLQDSQANLTVHHLGFG